MNTLKNKTDKRIIKTKKAIRNSFITLATKKSIDDITVTDISETANINRKTFYNYFDSIDQVVDDINNDIAIDFGKVISDFGIKDIAKNPIAILEKLNSTIINNYNYYVAILKKEASKLFPMLLSKIVEILKNNMINSYKTVSQEKHLNDLQINVIVEFLVSGIVSAFRLWFVTDNKEAIKNLSDKINIVTAYGFNNLLEGI